MRKVFSQVILAAGVSCVSCFPLLRAGAQIAPQTQVGAPTSKIEQDVFAGDLRLQQIIDYRCENTSISAVLRELSEKYRFQYRLALPAQSDNDRFVTLHFTQQPLKNLLNSLPPLYKTEAKWIRDGKTLVLSLSDTTDLDGSRPATQAEADTQAQGRAFLDAAAKFSPDLQQRLGQGNAGDVRIEELPQDTQQILRDLLTANARVAQEQTRGRKEFDSLVQSAQRDDLTGGGISVSPVENPNDAVQTYEINFRFNGANGGNEYVPIRVNRFVDPKQDYHVAPFQQHKDAIEAENTRIAKACLESQEAALAQDARLKRPVTLTLDRVTVERAIQEIARYTDISTAADRVSRTEAHSFHFQNVPLKDVLAQVLAAYKRYTPPLDWAMRDANGKQIGTTERDGDTLIIRDAKGKIVSKMTNSPKPRGYATQYIWGWQKTGVFLFREYTQYDPLVAATPTARKS